MTSRPKKRAMASGDGSVRDLDAVLRELRAAARSLAEKLVESDNPTARWIGKDAVREFAKARAKSTG